MEEEKDELNQYQGLDRDRRSLEYTIYAREQADSNAKLDELEESRKRDLQIRDGKREEYNDNDTSLTVSDEKKAVARDQKKTKLTNTHTPIHPCFIGTRRQ